MEYNLNHCIRELALLFISNKDIVCSWGIHSITITSSSISFIANGFKLHGKVEIKPTDAADYCVYIDNQYICKSNADKVISLLDTIIERTERYGQDIISWLGG